MSGEPMSGPGPDRPMVARHGYFIVQARAEAIGAALQLSGVLENLATGGKSRFETASELGELLRQWGLLAAPSNRPT